MIEINVQAKAVYGETKYYPANDAAKHLARIAGTKTLTRETLYAARDMGCRVLFDVDATISNLMAA